MTTAALVPWRERYLTFGAPHLLQAERDEVLACFDSMQRADRATPRSIPLSPAVSDADAADVVRALRVIFA